MRSRDVRAHLYDILQAAEAVDSFTRGCELVDYVADRMRRSAVERQLEIIGEAMRRTLQVSPELELVLPDARRVVDFRNAIAHGYDVLNDSVVWDVAVRLVPILREQTQRILQDLSAQG